MAGLIELPPGAAPPPETPKWAPNEWDYVAGDRICPFSSSPWGAAIPVGTDARGNLTCVTPNGLTYVRCNRLCALFVADASDNPNDTKNKASGHCALAGRKT